MFDSDPNGRIYSRQAAITICKLEVRRNSIAEEGGDAECRLMV